MEVPPWPQTVNMVLLLLWLLHDIWPEKSPQGLVGNLIQVVKTCFKTCQDIAESGFNGENLCHDVLNQGSHKACSPFLINAVCKMGCASSLRCACSFWADSLWDFWTLSLSTEQFRLVSHTERVQCVVSHQTWGPCWMSIKRFVVKVDLKSVEKVC